MSESVLENRDPVKATIDRLVSMGCDSVPVELVVRAWRETLYPELESRVGARLTIGLFDAQLDEFEALVDADNEDGASQWLTDHVPHYPQIVAEEFDRLVGEAVDWFARKSARQTGASR
jgi:hypothetical protein